MLWQTLVISLTAQAFLFTIALGNVDHLGRFIASLLTVIAALASAQLFAKHRYFEAEKVPGVFSVFGSRHKDLVQPRRRTDALGDVEHDKEPL
jgi:hypothetical protein